MASVWEYATVTSPCGNGEVVVMDGGEWLQGAGEFSSFGRELTDQDWELFKPRKSK